MAPSLPSTEFVILELPATYVLFVTINLSKSMNALPSAANWELDRIWKWFDSEPDLRVAIITGAGTKAFSAGMDLKERLSVTATKGAAAAATLLAFPPSGFAGLTRRAGKKPIIAAVNGHAHGGGFEVALNADLVLASSHATFRLPDVLRGTVGLQGGLPRLCRLFGLQRANLLALTAYTLSAQEAVEWGFVAKVVDGNRLREEAIALARAVASMSPDSVIVTRSGVREAWEMGVEGATTKTMGEFGQELMAGENVREGLTAFMEKREPRWVNSKL